MISKYATHSLDDIHNYFVLNNIISDGGTWNMLQNIINKYGVVPYEVMKETKHTINTNNINELLTNKLKVFAKEIRISKDPKKLIHRQMKQIYKLLGTFSRDCNCSTNNICPCSFNRIFYIIDVTTGI